MCALTHLLSPSPNFQRHYFDNMSGLESVHVVWMEDTSVHQITLEGSIELTQFRSKNMPEKERGVILKTRPVSSQLQTPEQPRGHEEEAQARTRRGAEVRTVRSLLWLHRAHGASAGRGV